MQPLHHGPVTSGIGRGRTLTPWIKSPECFHYTTIPLIYFQSIYPKLGVRFYPQPRPAGEGLVGTIDKTRYDLPRPVENFNSVTVYLAVPRSFHPDWRHPVFRISLDVAADNVLVDVDSLQPPLLTRALCHAPIIAPPGRGVKCLP